MTTERSYYISKFHMFIFMYFFKIGMNFPTAYRCGMMWGDHLSSATGVSDRSGGGVGNGVETGRLELQGTPTSRRRANAPVFKADGPTKNQIASSHKYGVVFSPIQ